MSESTQKEPASKKELEIQVASLHAPASIPGGYQIDKTLSNAKIPGLKMVLTPMGLYCTVPGKPDFIIPTPNIAAMTVTSAAARK